MVNHDNDHDHHLGHHNDDNQDHLDNHDHLELLLLWMKLPAAGDAPQNIEHQHLINYDVDDHYDHDHDDDDDNDDAYEGENEEEKEKGRSENL